MSLIDVLGYEVRPQTGLRRRLSEVVATEPMSELVAKVAMPLDRMTLRATRGRATAASFLTGLPVLWVTTTGAKSGRPHEVPLLGIPTPGRKLALIGTSFGAERSPAWVHNLLAHPRAVIAWRSSRTEVEAVRVEPDRQEPIWEAAIAAYPAFGNYRERASHRTIHVFELEPGR